MTSLVVSHARKTIFIFCFVLIFHVQHDPESHFSSPTLHYYTLPPVFTRFATICFILVCKIRLGSNGSDRPDTTPWRIGDCYMGHVQDLVEILATLLIIIFIITHHHAMMSLKQSLRNILGVHVHHVYSCGYPNT